MKRAVIVHCWDGYPKYCWYPQTKKELEELGFEVKVPVMPETHTPKLRLWLPKLKKVIGEPDENLYLIGHSAGVITILKYLESLPAGRNIGGVVFIAGFTDDLGYKELINFFKSLLNFKKIKSRSKNFVAIQSDNDPFVPLKHGNIFKKKLGAKLIIKHGMDHFSGPVDDSKSITSLTEVSNEIKRMINHK